MQTKWDPKKNLDPKHRRLLSISSISSITLNISRTSPVLGSDKAKRLPARHTPCQQPRDAQKHHETDDSARSKNCFKLHRKKKGQNGLTGKPCRDPIRLLDFTWTVLGLELLHVSINGAIAKQRISLPGRNHASSETVRFDLENCRSDMRKGILPKGLLSHMNSAHQSEAETKQEVLQNLDRNLKKCQTICRDSKRHVWDPHSRRPNSRPPTPLNKDMAVWHGSCSQDYIAMIKLLRLHSSQPQQKESKQFRLRQCREQRIEMPTIDAADSRHCPTFWKSCTNKKKSVLSQSKI